MLDVLAAVLITIWVLVLSWQVARGAVSQKLVARLSGNPRLITGYRRSARALIVGSIGLIVVLAFLFLEQSAGINMWYLWALAALIAGGLLLSKRLVQTASAAEKVGASGGPQTK